MKLELLAKLVCPECGHGPLGIWYRTNGANGGSLVAAGAISDSHSEALHGVLMHDACGLAFPVDRGVACLLSIVDADARHWVPFLQEMRRYVPEKPKAHVDRTLQRLQSAAETDVGRWNREEMDYYDANVATAELRAKAAHDIQTRPLWHIYLERERHLLSRLEEPLSDWVLEVGAGNARTIFWLRRPATTGYHYVGTDISFKRLLLARAVIPEGDFVQCSALNLPFASGSFRVVIAFGMMHHLPDFRLGIAEAVARLQNAGWFLMHEPLARPRLLPDNRFNWLRRLFKTYEHSAHDKEIDLPEALDTLTKAGLEVRYLHLSGSVFRTVGSRLAALHRKVNGSRAVWSTLVAIDNAFVRSLCKSPNRLGPKGGYVVARKIPAQSS